MSPAEQYIIVESGNEMAALAANHMNIHVMGYYPITPSTQIAETLDNMKAWGEHDVMMIPGEGEHSAASICFGAACGGGRVMNATSAQGLLYSLEQLPAQAGMRFPMVLNVCARAVNAPLNIKCDHSDIYSALNTGWLILLAKEPQAVYDMNIMAFKIAEHMDVRLPAIVCFDGFFTSHQKRKVKCFSNKKDVADWLGPYQELYTAIDPANPKTIGPYMNDDILNNKKQLSIGMSHAYRVIPEVFREFNKLSGREYKVLNTYKMEDAEAALFILNSAYDTACQAVDKMRAQGKKVGVLMPTFLRPFPKKEVQEALQNVKGLMVADRADNYGAWSGAMGLEIKAALKDDPSNKTLVLDRVYGLGGVEFYMSDGIELLELALKTAETGEIAVPYDYLGANPGEKGYVPPQPVKPIAKGAASPGLVKVTTSEETGKLEVKGVNARKLTVMPERLVSGHGGCSGCGIFSALRTFLKGIEGDIVMSFHTGCAMVVTTGYPMSSFRVNYIHNLFQSGPAVMSGLVEMFKERKRRGEIPEDRDLTFIMVSGDGGMDIGMGAALGAAIRNHGFILLEYDNESYANTGYQLSYSTPKGHRSSTSNVGSHQVGKSNHHKDMPQLMAATGIPYIFTGVESQYRDLIQKAAKAQKVSKEQGLAYGKIMISCPPGWGTGDETGTALVQQAVDCCLFPLFEIENGITKLSFNPETAKKNPKIPVGDWYKNMGKSRHLLKEENKELMENIQQLVDKRWERLKARADHPLL